VSLVALLSMMPVSSALAQSSVAHSQTSPALSTSLVEIPAEDLSPVLSTLPVSDLGLSNAELVSLLAGLEGGALAGLSGTVATVASNLLSGNPSATLAQLTSAVQGNGVLAAILALAGVTVTPEGIWAQLSSRRS
jgi:hypothetical protein